MFGVMTPVHSRLDYLKSRRYTLNKVNPDVLHWSSLNITFGTALRAYLCSSL
jgi:hypothetical protein